MREFLSEFWFFMFRGSKHPLYKKELSGWSYIKPWKKLKKGCLPITLVPLFLSVICCGILGVTTIMPYQSGSDWYFVLLFILMGLMTTGEIIRWFTSLLATALTATTISAEVEAETMGLLRLMPVGARKIAMAKFSASVQQYKLPLIVVSVVRALFVTGIIVTIIFGIVSAARSPYYNTPLTLAGPISLPSPSELFVGTSYIFSSILALMALLLGLVLFLVGPFISTLVYAAVGLLASTFARTRGNGLMFAAGLRIAWGILSYIASQVIGLLIQLAIMPFLMLSSTPLWWDKLSAIEPSIGIAGIAITSIAGIILIVLLQFAAALIMIQLTTVRIRRLPFNVAK